MKRQSVMNPVVNETNSYSFINVILSIEMKLAVKNKENINIYNKETLLYIYTIIPIGLELELKAIGI